MADQNFRTWVDRWLPSWEVAMRDGRVYARKALGQPWLDISAMTVEEFAKIAATEPSSYA